MLCPDFVLDVYTTQYIAPQYIIKKNTNLMCVNCRCSGAVILCLVTERHTHFLYACIVLLMMTFP